MTINSIKLSDCIVITKGKPPAEIPYFGLGAEPYLNPEYLRGNAQVEHAKAAFNAVKVSNGETILLWDGSNAGEFFRGRDGILASTMALVSHGEEFNPNYFYYALKHFEPYLKGQTSGSGIPHVDKEVLGKLEVFLFPTDEQQQIAKILSTLDQAIEQTEAIIAKQQRIKTGLMQDLLTKGIDDNGNIRSEATHKFKDSPLGRIPVEWTVKSTENFCDQVVDCPHTTPIYELSGIPCIRTADMIPGQLLIDTAWRVSEDTYNDRVLRLIPRKGDIIYSREGERLGIASPVNSERVCLGQRVMLLRPTNETNTDYFLWSMNALDYYRRVSNNLGATTSPHINVKDIKLAQMRCPPTQEQNAIGTVLAKQNSNSKSNLIAVSKFLRLRLALMQDLLIGKVRVTDTKNPTLPLELEFL